MIQSKATSVVVISDLHCGSSVGLCTPDFETNEGQGVVLNKAQQWLWGVWSKELVPWAKEIAHTGKSALILNGDLIEGMHHRTIEVISPDPADHVRLAMHVITPLAEHFDEVYVVRGTDAHTGPSSECGIGFALGAVKDPETGRDAFDRLDIAFADVPCRFVHHGIGTMRQNTRHSALANDLAQHMQSSVQACRTAPRVLGVGHFHHYAEIRDSSFIAFRTPAWQFHTRYTMKRVPWAENETGGIGMMFKQAGELPLVERMITRPKCSTATLPSKTSKPTRSAKSTTYAHASKNTFGQ